MEQALAEHPEKPPVQDISKLKSHSELVETVANMLKTVKTDEELDAQKTFFKECLLCAKQLKGGLDKSTSDVMSHLKSVEKQNTRRQELEARQKMKEELGQAERAAKAKATAVMKKDPDARLIYQLDVSKLLTVTEFTKVDEVQDWSQPWLIKGSKEAEEYCTQLTVAKQLTGFGGQYKRGQDYATSGRSSSPMPVTCKSETDAFFSLRLPKGMLDISDIPQGPGFMNTSFMWGFAPDMKWVGLAPTAAALTRVVAMGEARLRVESRQSFACHYCCVGRLCACFACCALFLGTRRSGLSCSSSQPCWPRQATPATWTSSSPT